MLLGICASFLVVSEIGENFLKYLRSIYMNYKVISISDSISIKQRLGRFVLKPLFSKHQKRLLELQEEKEMLEQMKNLVRRGLNVAKHFKRITPAQHSSRMKQLQQDPMYFTKEIDAEIELIKTKLKKLDK